MRLIPSRVAGQWAQPSVEVEVGGLENVIYCSEGSLRRVRRKLGQGQEGEGAIYVRAKRPGMADTKDDKAQEGKVDKDEEEEQGLSVEGWLIGWEEMPDGSCVLAGPARANWSEWASIRSASSIGLHRDSS